MGRKKSTVKKKALLIEPNYSNKFPPVGLMKIATYFRNKPDWEVVFYKGDLKAFVVERIVENLVNNLKDNDSSGISWDIYKDVLTDFIKTRKKEHLERLPLDSSDTSPLLIECIYDAKNYYWKGLWEDNPEWDFVGVTTLFTFYWDITVETINFAKKLVKDTKNLMVGGVLASIQPEELEKATGIKPHIGILGPGGIDPKDKQNIDELELDYSILDEIDYKYDMSNAYYRYTTRGCIRHCAFCAVPTLEPIYQSYIPLKCTIDKVDALYGSQKDLLLMDNNVLASEEFPRIIKEIIDSGFGRGALYIEPNKLEIAIRNLENHVNDRAYTRKAWQLIQDFYESIKGEDSFTVYQVREKYHIEKFLTSTRENLIAAYGEIKELYAKHRKTGKGKMRFVDFNQGVDARLFTPEKVKLLSQIAIRPLRIAFDDLKTEEKYCTAIKMSHDAGLKDFSNYLLYNFNDHPDDLYKRLQINVKLCDELGVSIYSFPMKYHPIRKTDEMDLDYSHNRDYIGKYWNRKYIRAVQAVLNSTKGKIGRGTSFFEKAFGKDLDDYRKLLEMPETMIIYRFFFEWLGSDAAHRIAISKFGNDEICKRSTIDWWADFQRCKENLPEEEWQTVLSFIHKNCFDSIPETFKNEETRKLLEHYSNSRKEIVEDGTVLFQMKACYDENPTVEAKRHNKK